MKLDMGLAWSQALAMLKANRDLVLVMAGVFFFLPNLALVLMVPDLASQLPVAQAETDPQVMLDALMAIYARLWLPLVLLIVLQSIGSLSLIALLCDASRPTLGEAIKLGLIGFLSYIGAQLLVGLAIGVTGGVLVAGAAAVSPALAVVVLLLLLIVVSVIQMILGLVFAIFGAQVQLLGDGIVGSLLNGAWAALMLAVIAAAHQQLSGGAPAGEG